MKNAGYKILHMDYHICITDWGKKTRKNCAPKFNDILNEKVSKIFIALFHFFPQSFYNECVLLLQFKN